MRRHDSDRWMRAYNTARAAGMSDSEAFAAADAGPANRAERIEELRERERDFYEQIAHAKEAEAIARREFNRACEELLALGERCEFPGE